MPRRKNITNEMVARKMRLMYPHKRLYDFNGFDMEAAYAALREEHNPLPAHSNRAFSATISYEREDAIWADLRHMFYPTKTASRSF